ncbi:MAG: F0F1 ATP synthase subunit B [Anaerolineales bacterium]
MEKLGLNLGYLLVQIFNFLILFLVLKVWVYKPIMNLLDKRRQTIAQGLEDARVAAEARANAEREAEQISADAQAKASEIMREATERAESAGRDIRAEMEAEAAKAKDAALAEAMVERDRMLADVRGQIATLAMAATQKLIGETLDEKRQHVLLDEFFSGVKAGKVVVLEGAALSGSSAEITSALPLTSSEQDTIKKDVLSKIGDQATVAFRVDPSILGGLIIRVGDKVLDNSVANQMDELRQKLV